MDIKKLIEEYDIIFDSMEKESGVNEVTDEKEEKNESVNEEKDLAEIPADMEKAEYKEIDVKEPEVEKAPIKEEVADKITFKLGDADVEVTNETDEEFTAEEILDVIEKENPAIFFNNADAYHFIMDFSFEKNGKTYWIESKNIEGDFSKFELNIYSGINESKSLLKAYENCEKADIKKAEYNEIKAKKIEVDKPAGLKEEKIDEVSLETAELTNDLRQADYVKKVLDMKASGEEIDREIAKEAEKKLKKNTKLLKKWKKSKGIEESVKTKEEVLDKIVKEVYAKIEKLYNNDKDLMEYVYVEPVIKKGHYDDGSDLYGIEVRLELDYDGMMNMADELDPILRKYDKDAYFDMETGGIMMAALNLDKYKSLKEDWDDDDDYEDEDEDWEEMLYDFIAELPSKLEKELGKEFSCHQTDDTVYVNCNKYPDNTVFIQPIEDSTQMVNVGILDDSNEEMECYEIDVDSLDDWSVKNIADNVKELFEENAENIDESLNEMNDRTVYNVKQARRDNFRNSGYTREEGIKFGKNDTLYNQRIKSKGLGIEDGIDNLVNIGFDKLSAYKPSVVKAVKEIMARACELGLAEPYDFGKGKGKYRCVDGNSIEDVVKGLLDDKIARKIAMSYVNKQNKGAGLPLRTDESLNEEVVAKFDNGKHEIVKCDKGYFNRYNIKEGKARFTTKCVESLPTALTALKKRFPKAEEVKVENKEENK